MSAVYFLPFEHDDCFLSQSVGGKAKELGWLTRRGFQVPLWRVLSTKAHDYYLDSNELKTPVTEILNRLSKKEFTAAAAATQIATLMNQARLPEDLEQEIKAGLRETFGSDWQNLDFAVRSSIEDEDGAKHSFAGQMDSFLFQKGFAAIETSIRYTYLSAFSERALSYRIQHGLALDQIRAAVILQQMIAGEVSGVCFTAQPVTGSRKHALISANYGCGDGVVSGACDCDEFTVAYADQSIQSTIANKETLMSRTSAEASGLVQSAVEENLKRLPCLTNSQILELTLLCQTVANAKKCPQDIEWTLSNQKIYLLQCRPITKLPPEASTLGNGIVFDNSNIQESYCGITLPLTFSFASRSYFDVYRQLMKITGFAESEIAAHDRRHQQMLGLVQGRVYYHINHWYEGLLLLPSFGRNKADMEKMMGVTEPVEFVKDLKLTGAQKVKRLPGLIKVLSKLLREFARIDSLFLGFEETFSDQYARFDRAGLQTKNGRELAALAEEVRELFLKNWGAPIINDFYVMMMNGKVSSRLKKIGFESESMKLLAGEELASALPTQGLMALAAVVQKSPELIAAFERYPDSQLHEVFRNTAPPFFSQCEAFIERFGDRCIGELKLESISMREDPQFVYQVVRSYLKSSANGSARSGHSDLSLRITAEGRVKEKLGTIRFALFMHDVKKLRKGIRYRESMRFARTRVFGLFRTIYIELGARLQELGQIESSRDVFYLTVSEIDDLFFGKAVQLNLKTLIALRKAEYETFAKDEPAHHLSTGVPYFAAQAWSSKSADLGSNDQVLKGIGCFPGIVRKSIRLIHSPHEKLDLQDRILCTMRTDPGWTPLFASISGLLVERGSSLSHSAVVAREMGVPAIVGIPSITQFLQDQELVEMDGTLGTVSRIQTEHSP